MKKIAIDNNINTAKYGFAFNDNDIIEISKYLNYPVIVKHYNGYSSVGMTKNSKCFNFDELFYEAKKIIENYKGALIEEFIEGREFTVLVTENSKDEYDPIVYEPVECIFNNGETFKHFELKWKEYESIKWIKSEDKILNEKLIKMAKDVFLVMKGTGYARLDIRVNNNNEP